jgi:hypothetical protein
LILLRRGDYSDEILVDAEITLQLEDRRASVTTKIKPWK